MASPSLLLLSFGTGWALEKGGMSGRDRGGVSLRFAVRGNLVVIRDRMSWSKELIKRAENLKERKFSITLRREEIEISFC